MLVTKSDSSLVGVCLAVPTLSQASLSTLRVPIRRPGYPFASRPRGVREGIVSKAISNRWGQPRARHPNLSSVSFLSVQRVLSRRVYACKSNRSGEGE